MNADGELQTIKIVRQFGVPSSTTDLVMILRDLAHGTAVRDETEKKAGRRDGWFR